MISKSLRDTAYYKKKALVRKIVDGFIGEVEMLDSGDVLRVDQRELETVLPDIGKPVLVVSGVGQHFGAFWQITSWRCGRKTSGGLWS